METGMFFDKGCGIKDSHRINRSVNKSSEKPKKGSKKLTAIRKNTGKDGGPTYNSEAFTSEK